jgi:hypothetical protein
MLSPLSFAGSKTPKPKYQRVPEKKAPFHETALYLHSRTAILNQETTPIKIRPQGPQILGWATLSWFIGVITTFATEQLLPFAQDLRKDLPAKSISLSGMALDVERVFMGTAVVLITINAIWALKNRKKELDAINNLETPNNKKTNLALWLQASKDLKLLLLTPVIAAVAVTLNTIKMIAPMLKTGMYHIFGAIGGVLFSLIEAFQLYGHAKNAYRHQQHLKALKDLKSSDDKELTPAEATHAIAKKISVEEMLDSLHNPHKPKDEKALEAMTEAFTRMKKAGFDLSKPRTREQWIDKAITTHTHAKKFEITKAVIHFFIGAAMVVAFAGGHIFTLTAAALGTALWVTLGSLATRLGIALTPERKILNHSLNKPTNNITTVFNKTYKKLGTSDNAALQTPGAGTGAIPGIPKGFSPEL